MQFRKDINGLRAIAVAAVVLFHFSPKWVPGGFVGVDVFFVISGFLMTGIIINGLEKNNFSILKFYVARANRIIPALALLCLCLLIFGWFFILPTDYESLGKHVASSIGFISNIVYLKEAGYFDSTSHEKWLLHTWSLSVEWQFYIIYPLILVFFRKMIPIKALKSLIFFGAIVSLVMCIWLTSKRPDSAYFLFPTRAWEMMLGGIAYLYPFQPKYQTKLIEYIGLVFIVASCFFISSDDAWPGYLALLPVLGAFLVIQAHRNKSIITTNSIFQSIGTWSYSIYLWHWPIVVCIYYYSLEKQFIYLGIGLSILIGRFSRKYIEEYKFKSDFKDVRSYVSYKPFYFILTIGILGSATFSTKGFESHYSDAVIKADRESFNKNPYKCKSEKGYPCFSLIGDKSNIKAIIIGDSHAEALTTSLSSHFDLVHSGVLSITKSACPFILHMKSISNDNQCLIENQKRLAYLEQNYLNVPIFWVARSSAYLYGQSNPDRVKSHKDLEPLIYFSKRYQEANANLLNEVQEHLIDTIKKVSANRKVYIVLPTPEMRKNVPKVVGKAFLLGIGEADVSTSNELYYKRNNETINTLVSVAEKTNSEILNPIPYLCSNGICSGIYKKRPIYFDGDHLSEYGNKLLTPMFSSVFE